MSAHAVCTGVIETLAASEATLREHVEALAVRAVTAEVERDAYRMVAVAGLHHAHDLHVELQELRERHERALEDARGLRVQLLQRAA